MDEAVVESTKVLGALTATDGDLYSPIYLRKSPFIRLELQPFAAQSSMLADEEVLVTLLLHRSGVALLTFYTVVGSHRSTDELLQSSISRNVLLETTTFPGTVIGVADPAHEVDTDEWVEPNVGIVPDRKITWKSDFSMVDAFMLYRDRVDWLAGKREGYRDYFCYTTVVVDGLECCGGKNSWIKAHSRELAGLVMRVSPYGDFDADGALEMLPRNFSLYGRESRYYHPSNALVLGWDFDVTDELCPPFTRMINTVAVIEHSLLQYWQIHSLDDQLSIGSQGGIELSRIQRRLAEGIEEYRASTISYGSAQEIADSILSQLHANELHQRLLERLNLMQQLISAQQAQASVRRNFIIAGVGSMATVLLGIPAIRDSLAVISQWKPTPSVERFVGPIIDWAKGGPPAILSVYGGALCLIVALFVIGFSLGNKTKRPSRLPTEPGMEWTPMSPSWSMARPRYSHGKVLDDESEGDRGNG
ncbi:hypothetical protein [Micromonospora sp. NBC_00421]|uniref:hypothetical protein n=1 Tax=Micromonospora sp. NBC_00421 TaxID=2975976 RepID=UPI002E21B387